METSESVAVNVSMPFNPQIKPDAFSFLGTSLTLLGLIISSFFLVLTMSKKRNIFLELAIGLVASVFLGFGTLFVGMSFGLFF